MKKVIYTLSLTLFLTLLFLALPLKVWAVSEAMIYVGTQQQTGYTVSFDGTQSTGKNPMGDDNDIFGIKTYSWNFGDGSSTLTGDYYNTVTHSYNTSGNYTINLTVTDYFGQINSTSKTIVVGTLPKITVNGNTSSSIQNAIGSLNSHPGIVYLPAGDYSLNSTLNIPANTIIEGAVNSQQQPQTRLHLNFSGTAIKINGDNVRLTGLEIIGPGQSYYGVDNSGGHINLYVDHCDIYGFQYANIVSYYATTTFEHNRIHDNPTPGLGYGIMVTAGGYVIARNNEFFNSRHSIASGGRGTEPGWNTGYDFIQNHVYETSDYTGARDVAIDGHAGIQGRIRISDNLIENIPYAIGLRDGWGEIRRNTFKNVRSYICKLDEPTYSGTWIPGGGIHDFYIDYNEIINCGTQWRLLYASGNIYLNCRLFKPSDLPWTGSATWNDCQAQPSPTNPVSKPGDANNDGRVTIADYIIWLNHYGMSTVNGPKDGDFDNSGSVGIADYIIWLNNYGT